MRHEIRDSNSLHFAMEVVIGGTPVTGLSPSIRIYSVLNDEYWDFSNRVWDAYDPTNSTGTMAEVEATGLPGAYQFDATDATSGGIPFSSVSPTSSLADSAEDGYVIRMEETTSGLLEYIYVVVNDVMVSSATVSGTVDANVVDWGGAGATISVGDDTNLPAITVAGWADATEATDGLVAGVIDQTGSSGTFVAFPSINTLYYGQDNTGFDVGVNPTVTTAGIAGQPDVNVAGWGNSHTTADAADISWSTAKAEGIVTVAEAEPTGVLTIDVFTFASPGDYAGADPADAAINLQAAIAAEVGLATIVTSEVFEGNRVRVVAIDSGSAGNLIVFSSTVGGLTISGSGTLTGGSENKIPNINVAYIKDKLVESSVQGMPDVNVLDWNGNTTMDRHANISLGGTSILPEISVRAWNQVSNSVDHVDVFVQTSIGSANVGGGQLPAITVEGWAGLAAADISCSSAFARGVITVGPDQPGPSGGFAPAIDCDGVILTLGGVPGWTNGANISETAVNIAAAIEADCPLVDTTSIGEKVYISASTAGSAGNAIGLIHAAGTNLAVTGAGFLLGGSENSFPNINVEVYKDKLVKSGVKGMPDVNVMNWDGDTVEDRYAAISVGDSFGFPHITVKAWEGYGTVVTSSGNAEGTDDILVTWTEDYLPAEDGGTPTVAAARPNIRAQIIGNNAIDEDAIQIDSVTYDEISTSAAREISDAVWSADIFKTLYNDTGTPSVAAAPDGSMAHAMIVQYLSQNMIHGGASSYSGGESSPVHTCSLDGEGKFYSERLIGHPLLGPEFVSYMDRSVVIVKNFEFSEDGTDGMAPTTTAWNGVQVYLGRIAGIGTDGFGRQYFQINLVDEDETVPQFIANEDILIVKAETDSTMHEVAHEVWEEEVADHDTKHTFGMFNRIIAGLAQYNHRIQDSTYDESGRLLACRLVVYPSAALAETGDLENALTIVTVTSEYNEKQNMTTFLSAEEGEDVDPDTPE